MIAVGMEAAAPGRTSLVSGGVDTASTGTLSLAANLPWPARESSCCPSRLSTNASPPMQGSERRSRSPSPAAQGFTPERREAAMSNMPRASRTAARPERTCGRARSSCPGSNSMWHRQLSRALSAGGFARHEAQGEYASSTSSTPETTWTVPVRWRADRSRVVGSQSGARSSSARRRIRAGTRGQRSS